MHFHANYVSASVFGDGDYYQATFQAEQDTDDPDNPYLLKLPSWWHGIACRLPPFSRSRTHSWRFCVNTSPSAAPIRAKEWTMSPISARSRKPAWVATSMLLSSARLGGIEHRRLPGRHDVPGPAHRRRPG
jgi:hypothetical protein